MPATKTSLQGGGFQDSEGGTLANGYLIFELSQDATVTDVGNVAAGIAITIQLDGNGNVLNATSPGQQIWANDVLLPVNTFYRVTGYTAAGQPAWGPNNQQVTGGSPFNLGSWIPNQITSWVPPLTTLALQTNGVANGSQSLLNLESGANVSVTDNGSGGVTIAASTPAGIALETNGTPNASQTVLNLESTDASILITDAGSGNINLQATAAPSQLQSSYWSWQPLGSAAPSQVGFFATTITANTLNVVAGTSTLPPGIQLYPSGGIPYGAVFPTYLVVPVQFVKSLKWKMQLNQTTDCRIWMGLSTATASSSLIADIPNYDIVGFRYSTNASDTKWQCVTQTDSSHYTITPESTASHIDTGVHTFEIQWNGANVLFYIDNTLVGSQNTNVPTSGTGLGVSMSVDSVSGSNGIKMTLFGMYALGAS